MEIFSWKMTTPNGERKEALPVCSAWVIRLTAPPYLTALSPASWSSRMLFLVPILAPAFIPGPPHALRAAQRSCDTTAPAMTLFDEGGFVKRAIQAQVEAAQGAAKRVADEARTLAAHKKQNVESALSLPEELLHTEGEVSTLEESILAIATEQAKLKAVLEERRARAAALNAEVQQASTVEPLVSGIGKAMAAMRRVAKGELPVDATLSAAERATVAAAAAMRAAAKAAEPLVGTAAKTLLESTSALAKEHLLSKGEKEALEKAARHFEVTPDDVLESTKAIADQLKAERDQLKATLSAMEQPDAGAHVAEVPKPRVTSKGDHGGKSHAPAKAKWFEQQDPPEWGDADIVVPESTVQAVEEALEASARTMADVDAAHIAAAKRVEEEARTALVSEEVKARAAEEAKAQAAQEAARKVWIAKSASPGWGPRSQEAATTSDPDASATTDQIPVDATTAEQSAEEAMASAMAKAQAAAARAEAEAKAEAKAEARARAAAEARARAEAKAKRAWLERQDSELQKRDEAIAIAKAKARAEADAARAAARQAEAAAKAIRVRGAAPGTETKAKEVTEAGEERAKAEEKAKAAWLARRDAEAAEAADAFAAARAAAKAAAAAQAKADVEAKRAWLVSQDGALGEVVVMQAAEELGTGSVEASGPIPLASGKAQAEADAKEAWLAQREAERKRSEEALAAAKAKAEAQAEKQATHLPQARQDEDTKPQPAAKAAEDAAEMIRARAAAEAKAAFLERRIAEQKEAEEAFAAAKVAEIKAAEAAAKAEAAAAQVMAAARAMEDAKAAAKAMEAESNLKAKSLRSEAMSRRERRRAVKAARAARVRSAA